MVWSRISVKANRGLGITLTLAGVGLYALAAAQTAQGVLALTPAEMKWASQGGLAAPGMEQLNLLG